MFHTGIRTGSAGPASPALQQAIHDLLDEFIEEVRLEVKALGLRRAIVRSMLSCSTLNVLDGDHLFVAAQKHFGVPQTVTYEHPDQVFSLHAVYERARWEAGFDAPFVVQFPIILLHECPNDRRSALRAIATEHVRAERDRVENELNMVQISPIFGPARYPMDSHLAFVLMPFTDELTRTYTTLIKPTIQDALFGLVCRRADDIKSNKAVIQDIWKSICEARLVVADLTGLNPNVMYELGIAHTLGKETILIYQRGADPKFPFDLAHIRRIEYANDAAGGIELVKDLRETLSSILAPTVAG
jgi:hypothetical protein